MKFWLTLVTGVVIITVISTSMYVINPEMGGKKPIIDPPKLPEQKAPPFDAPKRLEERSNLPQHFKGETVFPITNTGTEPLELVPDKPNCTCAALELSTGEGKDHQYLRLIARDDGRRQARLRTRDLDRRHEVPGAATWREGQTGSQMGYQGPARQGSTSMVPLRTAEGWPLVKFRVVLDIHQDVVLVPRHVQLGQLTAGTPASGSVVVYSVVDEKLEVLSIKTSSKSLEATKEPLTPTQLAEFKAKSGYKINMRLSGKLPVGHLHQTVEIKTNRARVPIVRATLYGQVSGTIDMTPSRVNFRRINGAKAHSKKVHIFVRDLKAKDLLKVGKIEPKFLQAKIEKQARSKTEWILTVTVPDDAPAGTFRGNVTVENKQGETKLNVRVDANIIDAGLPVSSSASSAGG